MVTPSTTDKSSSTAALTSRRKHKGRNAGSLQRWFSWLLLAGGSLALAVLTRWNTQNQLWLTGMETREHANAVFIGNTKHSTSTSSTNNNQNSLPPSSLGVVSLWTDQDEALEQRNPTHTACQNYDGLYHIAMGDIGGAAGTIFYQFVVAQILYAEHNNLKPWVHLSNVSHIVYDPRVHGNNNNQTNTPVVLDGFIVGRNATYVRRPQGHRRDYTPGPPNPDAPARVETLRLDGTGVWEHYFEPVSDFVPGDSSCRNKLYVTMDLYLITPGLHGYAEYAPRCWRYPYLPDYITKPHLSVTEWLEPQRATAHRVVQQYLRPRAYLQRAAERVNPNCSSSGDEYMCLGLHIRHSDKAAGRRIVSVAEFLPYAEAFVAAGGRAIYLATDSALVLEEIATTWPAHIRVRIRTAGENLLRSRSEVAVFDLQGRQGHHRTNQEVLVEILALAKCQFLVHGYSAVSEAAIWTQGMVLHEQSVNLEDPDRLNAKQFQTLVEKIRSGTSSRGDLPRPIRSTDVWPALHQSSGDRQDNKDFTAPTNRACEGFDGVLLISTVGRTATASQAFFTAVLNQIVFAQLHNLKPWVHLRTHNNDPVTALICDARVHGGTNATSSFEMKSGMAVSVMQLNASDPRTLYPGRPAPMEGKLTQRQYTVPGNGIWNSYLESVSDFIPGDESCRNKPLIEMEELLVNPGLQLYAPFALRAWRYDGIPAALWWEEGQSSERTALTWKQWVAPVRSQAHDVIRKYYRFRPYLLRRAAEVNPVTPEQPCLGLHLRNGDKSGNHRRKIQPKEFEPYLNAFANAGGRVIYVASDSHRALQFINNTFPERLSQLLRSQGRFVVRSTKLDWPAHYIASEHRHRVNSEVLVDILALSQCQLLLHGFSTTSEAAIYLNYPTLHDNSVNLEDPLRLSPEEFEVLAQKVIAAAGGEDA